MARLKTPVRKLHLLQIGSGLAPRFDVQSSVSYAPAVSVETMHSGAEFDFYAGRRAPVRVGTFQHSGRYVCCGTPCTCGYVVDEVDRIQQAKGVWTPMLFYTDVGVCPNPPQVCKLTPDCGIYLWAYGRVTQITNATNTSDYLSPLDAEVMIAGSLVTPLIQATFSRWRFGVAPNELTLPYPTSVVPTPNGAYEKLLEEDYEERYQELPDDWYMPCEPPDACSDERFWPRNLKQEALNSIGDPEPANWDCPWIRVQGASNALVTVYGNTAPRTFFSMTGGTELRIRNRLGTFIYAYGRPDGVQLYGDSWTGIVMGREPDYTVSPSAAAGIPPALEWGENIVSVNSGVAYIGYRNAWIN